MSPKKRTRKKRGKKDVPTRVTLFAILLVAVTIAGIASVKFFKTTRGKVVLLDAGITDYYSIVQEEIDAELRQTIKALGFERTLESRMRTAQIGGRSYHVHEWVASCSESCSPDKIGLAFTRAAKKKGAIARSKLEGSTRAGGETIRVMVGTRRYPTHHITIRQPGGPVSQSAAGERRPRLALVIDDFGYSTNGMVRSFLGLDLPLTLAVIPALPHSRDILDRAGKAGKETILHVPMESEGHDWGDAKNAVITTGMSDDGIRALLAEQLDESTGIVGVNNHQGSLATRDRRVMLVVISVLKNRRLFFLDSLTSPESIAYNTARSLEVPTAKNDLFIDDGTKDPHVIEERLLRLIDLAKRHGSAIGIGHPKPWTLEALENTEKRLRDSGVDLVFVSELME